MAVHIVILAAGIGSRLGRALPKPLTQLRDGRSIMAQQHDNVRAVFGTRTRVTTVVGYRSEDIVDAFPSDAFVYNDRYDETNTAVSLRLALRQAMRSARDGVLWMNGDVVFDPLVLGRALSLIAENRSFVAVNTARVADEEVKYTVDAEGFVQELSKTVTGGLGEAVGINYVSASDLPVLVRRLGEVGDNDYFERGIELAIERDEMRVTPLDISDLYAVEVDFAEDLVAANRYL